MAGSGGPNNTFPAGELLLPPRSQMSNWPFPRPSLPSAEFACRCFAKVLAGERDGAGNSLLGLPLVVFVFVVVFSNVRGQEKGG